MICRHARKALLEREIEPLAAERTAALERHLARCPGCAAVARAEARIAADLVLLREEVPFEVDVRLRVVDAIAATVPRRDEVSVRQVGWAAAAAAFVALLLLGFSRDLAPDALHLIQDAEAAAAGLGDAAAQTARALAILLALPIKLLGIVAGSAGNIAALLVRLEPVMIGLSALLSLAMASTIAWVLARDLRPHGIERGRG